MIIIFDLDYTLLDTGRFKKKLAEIFNQENFYADYRKYFKDRGVNFDLEKYLDMLRSQGRLNSLREKAVRLNLAELLSKINNYLFKEAERVLKRLSAGGAELILITFGDKKWQEDKVKNLSLSRYFNKIIFAEKNKASSEYLKSLQTAELEVLIINDNAKESKEIINLIGKKAKVFLVDGPYVNNLNHSWPIHKLAELLNI